MGYKVRVGDKIRLRLALEGKEDNTDVVVKCILRNAADTQIGSTLTLTHVGEGVFKDDSVDMPDTPVATARFLIYLGDGTTPHPDYFSCEDVFTKDLAIQGLIAADLTVAASSTTTNVRTNATQANNFYNGMYLAVMNSAGIAVRRITGYSNTNGAFTLDSALPFTPATSDRAVVLAKDLDIAAISTQVWSEALPGSYASGTAGKKVGDDLDATISSRLASASYTAPDNSTIGTINTKIGTPSVSVSADIATRAPASTALSTAQWTNTRAALLDALDAAISTRAPAATALSTAQWTNARAALLDFLDATISSRASQASVDAIQNNTDFVGIVPAVLVLPASGSKDYKIYAYLKDTSGNPEDPDANTINITIKDTTGSTVVSSTAMTRTAVGRYEYSYTVNSTDTERALNVFFDYAESSVSFQQVRVTEVQEFESKLDTLVSRLTATRAGNLDFLDVAVSSREAESDAASRFSDLEADIAAIPTTDVESALDAHGYTTARAVKLDHLDADISSRESEASAATRATTNQSEHDATQAAIAAIPTADVPTAEEIADQVWDEPMNEHAVAGSFGIKIATFSQNGNAEMLIAVIDAQQELIGNISDESITYVVED